MTEPVPISRDDLRHLFDLAVDTPLIMSGSFDTDDVDLLRRIAVTLGTDPDAITPSEFVNQYPHRFQRRPIVVSCRQVGYWVDAMGVEHESSGIEYPGRRYVMRQETEQERDARVAEEEADQACQVGMYSRPCGKPATDPIHISETREAAS
jgi:hypothetical protein